MHYQMPMSEIADYNDYITFRLSLGLKAIKMQSNGANSIEDNSIQIRNWLH